MDLTASHTLTQVYNNSSTRDISEAQYTFPLYESSAVTDFQALVGERTIKGVVKEKAEAKAVYQAAKSAGKVTALFSQDTAEVFTTSVGNIPAGGVVVVVIKYVHELKQDIDVDGVKLVIPTVIAPKYGNGPVATGLVFSDPWRNNWRTFSREIRDIGSPDDSGLSLSVTATMSGPIRGVTSPSHPISIGLGSHSSEDDEDFNPKKAHATLAHASSSLTGLDKDFSLLVKANNIGDPRAFLAPHPTLQDTSALVVTMVPKFALPPQGHEIIFVVDRSGSMHDKIATVRSALQLFLASLPVGSYFNICSFGSNHSSLWPQSQKYSEESLSVAKAHVLGLDSNMGGTEILAPVTDTMERRRPDMRTEILILTDGEVWGTENLFGFINESSKDGNVRFFSLGVGNTVSHSLVEGISRAGRGYSQIVDVTSNLQKKVMRMLKAALTPHVNDWDIDWAGKPEKQRATLTTPAPITVAPISLFDPNCNPDNAPIAPPSNAPTLTLPKIIQAPTTVPALFPYSRATVYFLISNGDRPDKVFLKGSAHDTNSNTICPLQIEIPVQMISSTGASLGLYQLAGRKLLQDFEESRPSYLEGIYDKTKEPTKYAELIAKEGTRVGVEFGLASKWTSFVAVAEDVPIGEGQADQQVEERVQVRTRGGRVVDFDNPRPSRYLGAPQTAVNTIFTRASSSSARSSAMLSGSSSPAKRRSRTQDDPNHLQQQAQQMQQMQQMQQGQVQVHQQPLFGGGGGVPFSASPKAASRKRKTSAVSRRRSISSSTPAQDDEALSPAGGAPLYSPTSPGYSPSSPPPPGGFDQPAFPTSLRNGPTNLYSGTPLYPSPDSALLAIFQQSRPVETVEDPYDLVSGLATLQKFNGMFKADGRIFAWLGLQNRGLENAHTDADLVATVAVIVALENKFPELLEEWEFMVAKAKEAVEKLYPEGDREAVTLAVRVALGL